MLDIGSIAGWLAVLGVGAVAWLTYRGGGGAALAVLETANRILAGRVTELEAQQRANVALIAELRGRTDVTLALQPLVAAFADQRQRADTRHAESLSMLAEIRDKLAPGGPAP